jgi:hypothetical protein
VTLAAGGASREMSSAASNELPVASIKTVCDSETRTVLQHCVVNATRSAVTVASGVADPSMLTAAQYAKYEVEGNKPRGTLSTAL